MSYRERSEKLQNLILKLMDKAKEDGVITDEEAKVLNTVKITSENYAMALEKAVEDNIITDDEKLRLETIEESLLSTTFDMIEKDDKLDDDERKMIELLFNSLMNILE